MKSKIITINNYKDYKKKKKKINIYKSILYYNTLFEVKNNINEKNIDYITNALNMKNRKKRIEYVYDQSCKLIDRKNQGINICGFENGKCWVQRKIKNGKCNGCCRKCIYQTSNGCSTKNLSCKLFNCTEVRSRYNVIRYNDLKLLRKKKKKNQIIIKSDYFSKREDVLKDLYSYSLIYSTFRIVYRLIRTYINVNKIIKK